MKSTTRKMIRSFAHSTLGRETRRQNTRSKKFNAATKRARKKQADWLRSVRKNNPARAKLLASIAKK